MKIPKDIHYSEKMLSEAMQMLESLRNKLGLFDKSRYCELKRRFDQHTSLNGQLRKSLNSVDTED